MIDDAGALSAESVDPYRLVTLLEEAGWRVAGGRFQSYSRLAPPHQGLERRGTLLVPLNTEAPEFHDLMQAVLKELSQDAQLWMHVIVPKMSVNIADEFRFRKDSSAPSGLIPWRDGEQLITSSRRALAAGAKFFMGGPFKHFSNKFGQFANRYLESLLMGQTAPGSYIVTAYAPAQSQVPMQSGPLGTQPVLENYNNASVRNVSQQVIRAVEATAEALEHYRTSGSFAGFDDGISRGVSYEMVTALLGMTSNSDGADITFEWDARLPVLGASPSVTVDFKGSDARVLESAATRLVDDGEAVRVTVIGRVHLLAKKEAGSPGVFGVDAIGQGQPRKVRVRLASVEDYHEAVRAHEEDLAVRVSGNLQREGNLNWLYNAVLVETLGPLERYDERVRRRSQNVEGQIQMFTTGSTGDDAAPEGRETPPG